MSAEQQAREMLERCGFANAGTMTAGNLVEVANLISNNRKYKNALETIAGDLRGSPSQTSYHRRQIARIAIGRKT